MSCVVDTLETDEEFTVMPGCLALQISLTMAHCDMAGAVKADGWICLRTEVCWESGTKGTGAKELRTLSGVGEMMCHRILTSSEMKTGRGNKRGRGRFLERMEGLVDSWLQCGPRRHLVRCFEEISWRWEVVGVGFSD